MEMFKDIPGYEGIYKVSDKGNVKSVRYKNHKTLKQAKHKSGYKCVMLSVNSVTRSYFVHQLVAMAFLDHHPDGHNIVVDHIDMDKSNNKLDNLRLTTQRENTSYKRGVSKFTGVHLNVNKKRWVARIYKDKKVRHIGVFNCETSAHIAYLKELNR